MCFWKGSEMDSFVNIQLSHLLFSINSIPFLIFLMAKQLSFKVESWTTENQNPITVFPLIELPHPVYYPPPQTGSRTPDPTKQ